MKNRIKRNALLLTVIVLFAVSTTAIAQQFTVAPGALLVRQLAIGIPLHLNLELMQTAQGANLGMLQEETVRLTNAALLPRLPGGGSGRYLKIMAKGNVQSGPMVSGQPSQNVEILYFLLSQTNWTAEFAKMNYVSVGGRAQGVPSLIYPYTPPAPAIARVTRVVQATAKLAEVKLTPPQDAPQDPVQGKTQIAQISSRALQLRPIGKIIQLSPQAVADTPCDTISTAVSATNDIHSIFTVAGLYSAKLVGNQSTKSAILGHLKNNSRLVAWNHIGHGNPSGIVLWDDAMLAGDLMSGTVPGAGVSGAVCLVNSCNVFNDPFRAAMNANSARTYIGGIVSLPIGPSEQVDIYFWYRAIWLHQRMDQAITQSASAQGLTGYFGLDGDSGTF